MENCAPAWHVSVSARAASVTLDARELDELRQTLFYSASSTKLWHTVDVKENQFGRIFFFFFFSSIGQRRKDCQVQQVVEIRLRIKTQMLTFVLGESAGEMELCVVLWCPGL